MIFRPASSPHDVLGINVSKVMLKVIIALLPGTFAMMYYFGPGISANILLAIISAIAFEALILKWRKRAIKPAISDLSAVVTAILFGLAIPPLLPWWMTVLGMFFAIVIVKQLYGGLGYNPFNPAMAAYALLLVSYPLEMTQWLPPEMLATDRLGFIETITTIFTGNLPVSTTWDAITMATPLDEMRTQLKQGMMISEIHQSPLWGDYGGRGWEWVANWYFLGGVWLIYKRVISWHIPVAILTGLYLAALLFYLGDPESYPTPMFHPFAGGTMLCAFFIATDPVTACTTKKGQLIYGALIGILILIIRSWGGYPDAIAFAVLLMNMAAPTIDYYSRPRTFGHDKDSRE